MGNAGFSSISWNNGCLRLLDQRKLPGQQVYLDLQDIREVAEAISNMTVRGAPLIGVAAAFGMVLACQQAPQDSIQRAKEYLLESGHLLLASRPTAVNLSWAVGRMLSLVNTYSNSSVSDLTDILLREAKTIAEEDILTNRAIADIALPLVPYGAKIIHHCNTGGLATVDYGTALGIIRFAHENGRNIFVFVDETRPRLQGARLTAWELTQLHIPHIVIVDGASGFVMQQQKIDLVTVGCDRIALNGDTANKIGTYNLAIAAKAHHVPFYVAAPTSTIDLSISSGKDIQIEERDPDELRLIGSEVILPVGSQVYNPAFDITLADYITAIITEGGIAYPPYELSLPQVVRKAGLLHSHRTNLDS